MTVGTSEEPLIHSIEKEEQNSNLSGIIALYGAGFDRQNKTPLDVVNQITKVAREKGYWFKAKEIPNPNNFDECLKSIREGLEPILREERNSGNIDEVEELVVNITGGTKPMAAALAVVVLNSYLSVKCRFVYVGGERRDETGRVESEGMEYISCVDTLLKERENEVLRYLKQADFQRAFVLSEGFPAEGKISFLKEVSKALYLWDNFQYNESREILNKLDKRVSYLIDDRQYGEFAKLVRRLKPVGDDFSEVIKFMKQLKECSNDKNKKNTIMGKFGVLEEPYLKIVADCFENARRRLERFPIETVMRCYRAIELAVKFNLLKMGINPDKPNWDEINKPVLERLGINPEITPFIMLDMGIKLLAELGMPISDDIRNLQKEVSNVRNNCYLEHGFNEVSKDDASEVLEKTFRVLSNLLDEKRLEDFITQLRLV